ncbi:cold-shock protein [Legionella adelaidensis]|nr:cold shock domain-containing protein [Legionella adelaidensis]
MSIIQKLKSLFSSKKVHKKSKNRQKMTGTIKFFDRKKRFGFIIAGKDEYFFHAAATRPKDFRSLQDGVAVKFNVIQGKKGPQAANIEIL